MSRLMSARRPHHAPVERLEILTLAAAQGWSMAETGRRFLVTLPPSLNGRGVATRMARMRSSNARRRAVSSSSGKAGTTSCRMRRISVLRRLK